MTKKSDGGIVKCLEAGKSDCHSKYARGGEVKCKQCGAMNCMAHGGKVDHEKGVHKASHSNENDRGRSESGDVVRMAKSNQNFSSPMRRGLVNGAKMEHESVLSESRAINPKLKGLAHGGEVDDMHEMPDMDGVDDELNDLVCDEAFEAIKKGDKKAFSAALKALILSSKE